MIISLAGVVMIAQPSFIFGGQGINKLGLALGIMQVSQHCMRNCLSSICAIQLIYCAQYQSQGFHAESLCYICCRCVTGVQPKRLWLLSSWS